jgi:hypothetical protein
MTDFTPAPNKKLKPVPLAHGMRLRNGQIMVDNRASAAPENSLSPSKFKAPKATADMRSRVAGHDVITARGPLKDCDASPAGPGQCSRNNDPSAG